MSTATAAAPTPTTPARSRGRGLSLGFGVTTTWLGLIVLLPLAAVVVRSLDADFWTVVTSRQAVSSLVFTLWISLAVAAINAVMGTLLAWVLVRDSFPGRRLVDLLIDLPFALPTIVAGLTLVAVYPDVRFTKWAVLLALLFVTLPFVVRAVQPVLLALDREVEEAAASLGARPSTTFRRVILPALLPAIASGAALAFARAVGEFGSVVLISGNIPFETQVASVYVFKRLESDDPGGAAAVAVVLLGISVLVLFLLRLLQKWGTR